MSKKTEAKKRLTYLKEKYVDGEGNIQSHNDAGELMPGCSNEEVAELSDLLEQEEKDVPNKNEPKPERKSGELSEVGKALKDEGADWLGNLPDGREFFYRKAGKTTDAVIVDGEAKVVGRRFGAKLIGRLKK